LRRAGGKAWSHGLLLTLLLAQLPAGGAGGAGGAEGRNSAAPAASVAVNWALTSAGASATANNAGYWAGYTAEARYALDGDTHTYWSSTGGATCCTLSQPAWLLVDLGAPRHVATLQLIMRQDMTYTLAAANASTGPFATVASRTCTVCRQNSDLLQGPAGTRLDTFPLERAVTASFLRLRITWSSQGGIGGCESLCDWATNVYEFRAYSPGALPAEALDSSMLAPAAPAAAADEACLLREVVPLLEQADDGAGAVLRDDAALQPRGGGAHGGAWMSLTAADQAHRSGSVEFGHVVRPLQDCGCPSRNFMFFTVYVRMGGGASMPGEGLVISIVDAKRQTPGATRFLAGCGTRPALPANAISVVFDSSDSDPACDEPGTGVRAVSTLDGERHPPLLLGNTLDMRTTQFRNGDWVPIQFEIENANLRHSTSVAADGSWETVQHIDGASGVDLFAPFHVWADGVMMVDASIMYGLNAKALRLSNTTLDQFYVVVSARTGAASSDGHAISGLRVECRPAANTAAFVENWDGLRQPLPASPPPGAPSTPPAPPWRATVLQNRPATQLACASFAFAFLAAAVVLGCACVARHVAPALAEGPGGPKEGCDVEEADAPLLSAAAASDAAKPAPGALVALPQPQPAPRFVPDAAQLDSFDVFLSYRRMDYRLADAVHDKLRLCGLRVFKDIDGRMAGTPFGIELLRAIRAAPVFAPVVNLHSLQRMARAAEPGADVDTTLGECLTALYFRATGDVRLIHPLLTGPEQQPAADAKPSKRPERWPCVMQERAYEDALAALPDAVAVATHASVSASLRAAFGHALPPEFEALTVREIMCGRGGDAPRPGVLSCTTFAVDCLPDDLGLYIRNRYAPPALSVAAEVAARRR